MKGGIVYVNGEVEALESQIHALEKQLKAAKKRQLLWLVEQGLGPDEISWELKIHPKAVSNRLRPLYRAYEVKNLHQLMVKLFWRSLHSKEGVDGPMDIPIRYLLKNGNDGRPELTIAKLIARGYSAKDIALQVNLKVGTVKQYTSDIAKKLKCADRGAIAQRVLRESYFISKWYPKSPKP